MSLILRPEDLLSRRFRTNFIAGKTGAALFKKNKHSKDSIRKIGSLTKLQPAEDKSPLGLAKRLWNGATAFAGWAIKGIFQLFGGFDASAIWNTIVQAGMFLWRFDWNASEDELQALVGDAETQMGAAWGQLAGSGVGWFAGLAIGVGVAIKIPVIGGAALAAAVRKAVSEEAMEELRARVLAVVRTTLSLMAKQAFVTGFANIRNWIKSAPIGVLKGIFGDKNADFIKNKWGNVGGPTYSMAKSVESMVEKIPSKFWKAFFENALEEAWDSFVESGFIVANEIDYAFSQQKLSNERQLGEHRTVVLEPDNRLKDEKLVFVNTPQNLLMPAIQSTLNTHRLIANRDVGMVIGTPAEEYAKAKPQTLRIVIQFYSEKRPPYVKRGDKKITRATYTIPDVKRGSVTWEKVKAACGGNNGFMWGRFRATANLSNGRQMACYGATEKEAEDRLKAFLALSNAEILTLSVTEEKRSGRRIDERLYKESIRIYPAFFTIINREEILDPSRGRASLKQNYLDRKGKILLWTETEPPDAREVMARLFQRGT